MLNCRACLWRCIEALDAPASNVQRLRRDVSPLFLPSQRRLMSTAEDVVRKEKWAPRYQPEVEKLSRTREDPWSKSAVAANQKKKERTALKSQPPQQMYDTPNLAKLGRRDPAISEQDWNNRKRELRHLQDPLELATFVKSELRKGRSTEMLQLVRMASHSMACVVSWNHIIDHYLARERVNDALKVYNDVRWL
jgi:pentatricopeptide repeat protein